MNDSEVSSDRHVPWLEASGALRDVIEQGMLPFTLTSGQTLFEKGDFDDRLYLLDKGQLEVSVLSASGRKLSLNQIRPGSVFGEIAIFDPGPRTARIEAMADSKLRAIRHSVLMAQVSRAPELAQELLRLAGRRMRWLSRQVEDQVFLPPAARLAAKLLHFTAEQPELVMSQAQLAEYVGVTREVVSRILTEWRRAGLVDGGRGRITVRDRDALLDICSMEAL